MSFDLIWPPILGAVGLVIAFAIYLVMSRYSAGEEKVRAIADEIHIGAMVFMHREYKMLFAFAAVLVVGILLSPLGTNTAIAFVAGLCPLLQRVISGCMRRLRRMCVPPSQPIKTAPPPPSTSRFTEALSWVSAWLRWGCWA